MAGCISPTPSTASSPDPTGTIVPTQAAATPTAPPAASPIPPTPVETRDVTLPQKITRLPKDRYYQPSPDSLWLLFVNPDGVFIYQIETHETMKIPTRHPHFNSNVNWSPDGQKIYFIDCTDEAEEQCFLVLYDVNRGILETLTRVPPEITTSCMTLSPQGDRLVYYDRQTGDVYLIKIPNP